MVKAKKQLGYVNYVNSGNLLIDTSLVRTGKDSFEWVYYTCRGIVVFMWGAPIGTTRVEGALPVGEKVKVHAKRMSGSAKDFDKFIMKQLATIFEDVEPGLAEYYALKFPIIEE